MAGEPWNQLGGDFLPAADFDGDGIRDLLQVSDDRSLRAYGGRDGRILWRSAEVELYGDLFVQPLWQASVDRREGEGQPERGPESGDLDGDGVVDVLVWSGQTGRVLWRQPCSSPYGRNANSVGQPPAMFPLSSPQPSAHRPAWRHRPTTRAGSATCLGTSQIRPPLNCSDR